MLRLTPKQRGFAFDYFKTQNAALTASLHYQVKDRKSAKVIGCRLMKNPKVIAFLREAVKDYIDINKIKSVIVESLNAKRSYCNAEGELVLSDIPDHEQRLKAVRQVLRYPELIEKEGEDGGDGVG